MKDVPQSKAPMDNPVIDSKVWNRYFNSLTWIDASKAIPANEQEVAIMGTASWHGEDYGWSMAEIIHWRHK